MNIASLMSRRNFIQAATAAGTAATLAPASALEDGPERTVRLGIVGVGSRGTHLLRTALQLPGVEVRAVCDIVEERAMAARAIVESVSANRPDAYAEGERDFENLAERNDIDAVLCATTWRWHTPVMLATMRAGKYGATEVPAAWTLEECWELVRTSEETGMPCMMLENVCYFENALTLLHMVRAGCFGELLHAEAGYQHDCRSLFFTKEGELTWRGEHCATEDGNLYPTHPIGPIAQWFNINRGNRFTRLISMSTKSRGLNTYATEIFGSEHPLAKRHYALGDVNTTLLQTANGETVTLYFDMTTPRPYDLILRLQGTKGIHMDWSGGQVYLQGISPNAHTYESFAPYKEKYAHPLWSGLKEEAVKNGGHGGSDYITMHQFIKSVRHQIRPPQDVYDAATWSAIVPLTIQSIKQDSAMIDFPDFTRGQWKSRPPLPLSGG